MGAIFIDREAREMMHLVASVRPFVMLSCLNRLTFKLHASLMDIHAVYYQCAHPSIIVRLHDQGASITYISVSKSTPLAVTGTHGQLASSWFNTRLSQMWTRQLHLIFSIWTHWKHIESIRPIITSPAKLSGQVLTWYKAEVKIKSLGHSSQY